LPVGKLVTKQKVRPAQVPGTHTILMERNRVMLFEAAQAFLDEPGRS
jgi:hypothetical protein